jgi:hypothetical protein
MLDGVSRGLAVMTGRPLVLHTRLRAWSWKQEGMRLVKRLTLSRLGDFSYACFRAFSREASVTATSTQGDLP